jgi:hypothetical protein
MEALGDRSYARIANVTHVEGDTTMIEAPGRMTEARSAETAVPKYNGLAIWASIDRPPQLLRHVGQDEPLTILDEASANWLHVKLPEGADGYVRRDAVRLMALAGEDGGVSAPAAPRIKRVAGLHAFPGAMRVSAVLTVIAWLSLIGGQLIGLGAAANYDCRSALGSSCGDESMARLILYLGFAGSGLAAALVAWVSAYMLLLLDSIELNTAGDTA